MPSVVSGQLATTTSAEQTVIGSLSNLVDSLEGSRKMVEGLQRQLSILPPSAGDEGKSAPQPVPTVSVLVNRLNFITSDIAQRLSAVCDKIGE